MPAATVAVVKTGDSTTLKPVLVLAVTVPTTFNKHRIVRRQLAGEADCHSYRSASGAAGSVSDRELQAANQPILHGGRAGVRKVDIVN